jgi:uncharacterized protein with NRDE domain
MCLLVVLHGLVPGVPMVVAANRDERYDRPSQSMTVLCPADPRTLGGRDEVAGGTWLAVNEHGVMAGLTNCPTPGGSDPTKRSRGELPLLLTGFDNAPDAVDFVVARVRPDDYNPCWLLVGDRRSLFYVDMTGSSGLAGAAGADRVRVRQLTSGLHVLENRPIDRYSAKAAAVAAMVRPVVEPGRGASWSAGLQAALADHRINPDPIGTGAPLTAGPSSGGRADTARGPCDTSYAIPGAGLPRPGALTACCVHSPEFGTRSSVIVAVSDGANSAVSGRAESAVSVLVADGPPCQVPFVDCRELWEHQTIGVSGTTPVPPAAR